MKKQINEYQMENRQRLVLEIYATNCGDSSRRRKECGNKKPTNDNCAASAASGTSLDSTALTNLTYVKMTHIVMFIL